MYDAVSPSDRIRDADLQRVDGAARVVFAPRLTDLYQSSPCRVLLPRVDGSAGREVVFANTAGGIAGGDRLSYAIAMDGAARVVATTQAAEKIYRAIDAPARIASRIAATNGGAVEWLPQETIVFDRARFRRRTTVEISGESSVLALEFLVLGRAAHGEHVSACEVSDSWRVRRDGRLIWADTLRLTGPMARPALLGDNRALATVVRVGPGEPIPGATMVNGVQVWRHAAPDAASLRRQLADAFALPKAWSC
jgi:urease accessory protein